MDGGTILSDGPGRPIEHPLLARLRDELAAAPPVWKKRRVELILGSDREIGRDSRNQEKRVGVVPSQVAELKALFAALDLHVDVLVVAGAGQRAGYADAHYVEAGAEIVTLEELLHHDGPPDVVHALKEPSTYEATIPLPFCRIGALHTGDFHLEGGLARLLLDDSPAAVFDGSSIGAGDAYRVPVRGSMSDFAGRIGAEWIVDHLAAQRLGGRVVVVGGGRAGTAATGVLRGERSSVEGVDLFDLEAMQAPLGARYAADDAVAIHLLPRDAIDSEALAAALDGATAVLFAVAVQGRPAPKVATLDLLRRTLHPQAMVVDISIDERGAIFDPAIAPSWASDKIIPHLEGRLLPRLYRAIVNMPRALPKPASRIHGEAVLPYLAALLLLAARDGGPEGMLEILERLPVDRRVGDPAEASRGGVLAALAQDLRNGLAFWPRRLEAIQTSRRLVVEDAVADRRTVLGFLFAHQVPCEFQLRTSARHQPSDDGGKADFAELPKPIQDALEAALASGIDGRVIYHPNIDGTQSEHAAFALGVDVTHVLKCMILKADDGRFVAALCEGGQTRLDLAKIAGIVECDRLEFATLPEVHRVTGYPAGGVPLVSLFGMEVLDRRLISRGVLRYPTVVGSAGSEFIGIEVDPQRLLELGGEVHDLTG